MIERKQKEGGDSRERRGIRKGEELGKGRKKRGFVRIKQVQEKKEK